MEFQTSTSEVSEGKIKSSTRIVLKELKVLTPVRGECLNLIIELRKSVLFVGFDPHQLNWVFDFSYPDTTRREPTAIASCAQSSSSSSSAVCLPVLGAEFACFFCPPNLACMDWACVSRDLACARMASSDLVWAAVAAASASLDVACTVFWACLPDSAFASLRFFSSFAA